MLNHIPRCTAHPPTFDNKLKEAAEVYEAVHIRKKKFVQRPERAYPSLRSRSGVLAFRRFNARSAYRLCPQPGDDLGVAVSRFDRVAGKLDRHARR
jgi:hypothetical protein